MCMAENNALVEEAKQLPDYIGRVANAITAYGASAEECRAILISLGLSEGDAYLTWVAGKIIADDREKARSQKDL